MNESEPSPEAGSSKQAASHVLDPLKPGFKPSLPLKLLESVPKAAAVVALLSYLAGVITVSIYLHQQDVPAPDLTAFKAKYIYTGLEVLLALGFAGILVIISIETAKALKRAQGAKATLAIFFPVIAPPFFLGVALWAGLVWLLTDVGDEATGHAALTALGFIALASASAALILVASREMRPPVNPFSLIVVALSLIAVVWSISFYGTEIYPKLPDQFGGGHPKPTRLLFTAEGAVSAKQIGVPFQRGSQLSRPLTMILDGDNFYAVDLPNKQTAQIAKSTVVGLQEDTKPPFASEVETRNRPGNRVGVPEAGDQLILTYSERMDAGTLIAGWNGEQIPGSIVVRPSQEGDELHFFDTTGKLHWNNLGTIELGSDQYRAMFGQGPVPVAVFRNDNRIVVTLKQTARSPSQPPTPNAIVWTPSQNATDTKGNRSLPDEAVESDPSDHDLDF